MLGVPMLQGGRADRRFRVFRQEVRPFTDKQIELVTNFADQAVIAIENTRLLNELRRIAGAADGDFGGSAGHQSSSPGELKPVFESMLENAVRICEAKFGKLFLVRGRYVQARCAVMVCRKLMSN